MFMYLYSMQTCIYVLIIYKKFLIQVRQLDKLIQSQTSLQWTVHYKITMNNIIKF